MNSDCVVELKQARRRSQFQNASRKYYENHKQARKEYNRLYYQNHKEEILRNAKKKHLLMSTLFGTLTNGQMQSQFVGVNA